MVRAGLTHKQIAAQFGVTRQAVSKRIGSDPSNNVHGQFSQYMPWPSVSATYQRTYIYRCLQDLVRRQLGMSLTASDSRSLDTFLAELDGRGVVVRYSVKRGWKLVLRDRVPGGVSDDEYMVVLADDWEGVPPGGW